MQIPDILLTKEVVEEIRKVLPIARELLNDLARKPPLIFYSPKSEMLTRVNRNQTAHLSGSLKRVEVYLRKLGY